MAGLYEVETKRLNEQVKRNIERFPDDFMFRLTIKEWQTMRPQFATASESENVQSQIATASQNKRNTGVTPYAFTEHGVTMLASVLKSEKAIKMSIEVVRAFIELKKVASHYSELAEQIQGLKIYLGEHDIQLNHVYDAIENLLDKKVATETWETRNRIGFKKEE